MTAPLLQVTGIGVHFTKRQIGLRRTVHAVDDVSFALDQSETLGLVGESGSGKSTAGAAVIGLQPLTYGRVDFRGQPLPAQSEPAWRVLRRQMQIVFQDPFSSLNPRRTVGQALAEPLRLHKLADRANLRARIVALLEQVGLSEAMVDRYPSALSGGQRQRVCIARALAVEPDLIVCDEITSALDVSTQAQIIALLMGLQKATGVSLLFISHDLGLVRGLADRVAVMYLGKIVEHGAADAIFTAPLHPYSSALIRAAPVPDPAIEAKRPHRPLPGEIPDPTDPPSGCRFRTRCPFATEICTREEPAMEEGAAGHNVACHHWREIAENEAGAP